MSAPVLDPDQVKPVANIVRSLKKTGLACVAADTGTGKTVMSTYIYITEFVEPYRKELALWKNNGRQGPRPREPKMIVVSTPGLAMVNDGKINKTSPWLRELTKYGMYDEDKLNENVASVTYNGLSGTITGKSTVKVIEKGTATWEGLIDNKIYSEFRWYEDKPDDIESTMYGTLTRPEILKQKIFNRDIVDKEDGELYPTYPWYSGDSVPFLIRLEVTREIETGEGPKTVSETLFIPTMNFMNFCLKYRVFVVFDEFHKAKNDSLTNMACSAFVRPIQRANLMIRQGYDYDLRKNVKDKITTDGGRCCVFLSATPLQDEGQAPNYARLIGYSNPLRQTDMAIMEISPRAIDMLNEAARFYYDSDSISHLIDIAKKAKFADYNQKTNRFKVRPSFDKKKAKKLKYDIWLAILRKIQFVVAMLIVRQAFNYFIPVTDDEGKKYLTKAIEFADEHKKVAETKPKEAFKILANIKKNAESGMVITMADEVFSCLKADPKSKHLVAFTRIENIRRFEQRLKTLEKKDKTVQLGEIGIVCGVSAEEQKYLDKETLSRYKRIEGNKDEYIQRFMEPNNKMRVIIGTFQKVREGIDFQDRYGGFQRTTWFVGDDDTVSEQQLSGRTPRYGMHSIPIINICYPANVGSTLIKVYANNIRRGQNEREVLEVSDTPVSEAEEKLSEAEKEKRRAFSKVPGEFNRRFKLKNGQDVALADRVTGDVRTLELIRPDNFLRKKNTKGKEAYWDTEQLLEYLNEQVEDLEPGETFDFKTLRGLTVLDIVDGSYDPYPEVK